MAPLMQLSFLQLLADGVSLMQAGVIRRPPYGAAAAGARIPGVTICSCWH